MRSFRILPSLERPTSLAAMTERALFVALFSDADLAQRRIDQGGQGDDFVAVQFDDLDHFAAFLRRLLASGFCAAVLDPVREEESGAVVPLTALLREVQEVIREEEG
jgi:hypothetical protein